MTAPNIAALTTITGKTDVLSVTTSATNITSNSAASGKVFKVNSLIVANVDGTNAADISASVYRSSTEYFLANVVTVPAGATLVVLSKDTGIYLEEGDAIRLTASANGDLQATCSYDEIS